MGRRHTAGAVGQQGVGGLQVNNSLITAPNNSDITIDASGTGIFKIASDAQIETQSVLRFADADSSNYVAFRSPATVTANVTWTLPATDAAASGYALVSNASGTLSWAQIGLPVSNNTTDSASNYILFNTATSGSITDVRVSSTKLTFQPSTGTLSSTIFTETSSVALKENIQPIENALDKIIKLTGFIYDRKDGSQKNEAGMLAEEVFPIIPNIVSKDELGNPATIAYQRLTPYIVEALKEIKTEIDKLKGVDQ